MTKQERESLDPNYRAPKKKVRFFLNFEKFGEIITRKTISKTIAN
jgi:hypothetical protein